MSDYYTFSENNFHENIYALSDLIQDPEFNPKDIQVACRKLNLIYLGNGGEKVIVENPNNSSQVICLFFKPRERSETNLQYASGLILNALYPQHFSEYLGVIFNQDNLSIGFVKTRAEVLSQPDFNNDLHVKAVKETYSIICRISDMFPIAISFRDYEHFKLNIVVREGKYYAVELDECTPDFSSLLDVNYFRDIFSFEKITGLLSEINGRNSEKRKLSLLKGWKLIWSHVDSLDNVDFLQDYG